MIEFPVDLNNREAKQSPDLSKLALPRTSQQRLKDAISQPPINKLVGEIWLSGELHILFADTGIGKSIFAVTIGDALSKGQKVLFLENQNPSLNVLYYDFELGDRQFLMRYSNELEECYGFSDHFFIDNIDFVKLYEASNGSGLEKALLDKIKRDINELDIDVLIFDNLTFLKTQTTQTTETALELMRSLNELKRELKISILVLAHTPKVDSCSPLTINSLAGSKHISNFADSVSAIGRSVHGSNIRYIKQVKPSRSAEMVYDAEKVITCELVKDGSMLTFKFLGFDSERSHLKQFNADDERNQKIEMAYELSKQGKKYSEIAEILLGDPMKKGTICKWLKRHNVSKVSTVSNNGSGNGGNDSIPF